MAGTHPRRAAVHVSLLPGRSSRIQQAIPERDVVASSPRLRLEQLVRTEDVPEIHEYAVEDAQLFPPTPSLDRANPAGNLDHFVLNHSSRPTRCGSTAIGRR